MVHDLCNGSLCPEDIPIIAVLFDGVYWGLCNRRLACLREHQLRNANLDVVVHLVVLPAWAILEKFIPSWTAMRDPFNYGVHAIVRG